MTQVNVQQLKELPARTGAGVMACRQALEEANGHMEQVEQWLRRRAVEEAARRGNREMNEGRVTSYLHHNGKLGVLVELNCETDFVARTEAFRTLARNVAEHVAAGEIEGLRPACAEQARSAGKPEKVIGRIVEGRTAAHLRAVVLMEQPWIRERARTIAGGREEPALMRFPPGRIVPDTTCSLGQGGRTKVA